MADHPIQGLMKTAMEQITEMVNVNTIVGDPIETGNGDVIMPISKVGFGFAAGGSDFTTEEMGQEASNAQVALPFGGGSGGGVSISPIAFLVVGKQGVRVVPLDNQTHLYEKLIDLAPQVADKIQGYFTNGTGGTGSGATDVVRGTGETGSAGSYAAPSSASSINNFPSGSGPRSSGGGYSGGSSGGYTSMGDANSGIVSSTSLSPTSSSASNESNESNGSNESNE